MRTTLILGLLSLTGPIPCLLPMASAQEPVPAPPAVEEPVPEIRSPEAARQGDETAEISEEAIRRAVVDLGSARFRVREAAEDTLRRAGEKARPALELATRVTADRETLWRVERLLDELNAARDGQDPGDGDRLRGPGLRPVPRAGEPDPLERVGIPEFDLFRQQQNEMRRRIDELFRSRGLDRMPEFGSGLRLDVPGVGQSVRIGPDGVRVEIRETDENGEVVTKTYEADSLEAFKEKYPEIAERALGGGGSSAFEFRIGGEDPFGGESILRPFDPRLPRLERLPGRSLGEDPLQPTSIPGPKLGVYIEPVSDQLAEFLGLTPGEGLYVREIAAGSMAETLDLRAHDVLLSISGRPVQSAEDVARALASLEPGGKIEVRFVRRGEAATASGTYQVSEPENPVQPRSGAGEQPPAETPGGGLRRIRRGR